MIYLAMFLTGLIAGRLAVVLSCWFLNDETTVQPARLGIARCAKCEQSLSAAAIQFKGLMKGRVICPGCRNSGPVWPSLVSAVTAIIFAGFTWLLIEGNCQTITEVRPSHQLVFDRLPFQLIFIFLMLVVTVTDLIDYAIPDFIIWIGIVVAVAGSTASGDLQMVHIWVDWSYELVEIYGPWLPEWMKHHQHLHGAAWSIAGLVTGAGIMLLIRIISSVILGQAAVGFGDVTLMMMIGAFMGWQPTLCVIAIAPIGGLLMGLFSQIAFARSFVAFGPYLTFSAFIVLCTWRILWEVLQLRIIFSHWPTVLSLVVGVLLMLSIMLGLLRLFKAVPASALKR